MEIGTTLRQTIAKHQRCRQLDLLKEGESMQWCRVKDRGMVWEVDGLNIKQVGCKQKPKQQSKAPKQDTEQPQPPLDPWDSFTYQLRGTPTKQIPWPQPASLASCSNTVWFPGGVSQGLADDINPPKGIHSLCIKVCLHDQCLKALQ